MNVIPANPSYPRPDEIDFWPKQQELIHAAKIDLQNQGWSLIKVGQRSGKSIMVGVIARDYDLVLYFDTCDVMNGDSPVDYIFCQTLPEELINSEWKDKKVLVLIHEPMWLPFSHGLFTEAKDYAHVLAIGSNGPQFEDGWKDVQGHSAATWEVNPRITKEECMRPGDDKAQRDYGAY